MICASGALQDGGDGVRFTVRRGEVDLPAFVVRHGGAVHAYINRCAHVPIELDWLPGRFFDSSRHFLICATHGAMYRPDTGACDGGPCRGGLIKIGLEESDGVVRWHTDRNTQPLDFPS